MLRSLHSADHAGMRFSRTIIRYKGKPCWVDNVNGDFSADARYLKDNKSFQIPDIRNKEEIDVVPVPLGFCDVEGIARYLTRMPCRRTKQGLAQEALYCEGDGVPDFYRMRQYSKALEKTINNVYSCFKEAYVKVGKDLVVSQAFHRNWAVWKDIDKGEICVLFKHFGKVGTANEDGTIKLFPEYSYLQETYNEEVLDVQVR